MALTFDGLEKWYENTVKLQYAFAGETPPEPIPMPEVTNIDGLLSGIADATHDALVEAAKANGYENDTVEEAYVYTLPDKLWEWVGIKIVGGKTVVEDGVMSSAKVTGIVSKDTNGNVLQTYNVPAEIVALTGYGWSVTTYSNTVDFSTKKFTQKVVEVTLDGTQDWKVVSGTHKYFCYRVADYGDIVTHAIVSDKISQVNITSSNSVIGIDIFNSSSAEEARLCLRPAEYATMTVAQFKTWLSNNPVTVHYALTTPVEVDISEYLANDIITDVVPSGTITFENLLDAAVPVLVDYVGKQS